MKIRISAITIILLFITACYTSLAFGAVSAEEAGKLGKELTPVGAEKAGNGDGSIPAWTGAPVSAPKGFQPGSGSYVDPFADEKSLFSINQKNMTPYADKLSEGVKAMMTKYPDYRIDVYKTHRITSQPFLWEKTKKCAATATLSNDGITLNHCRGGIPFPLPKTGNEIVWNHLIQIIDNGKPYNCAGQTESYNITAGGKVSLSAAADIYVASKFFDPKYENDFRVSTARSEYVRPARRNGEKAIVIDVMDYAKRSQTAWQYLPGQRRVRLAPELGFDTPNPGTAGSTVLDDTYVFNGSPERFNWKLIGKKEMYIPANTYKFTYYRGPVEKALLQHFVNPDFVRWELRRVWVVEATLKSDKRHIYSRRVFYADEDGAHFVLAENYDKRGALFRIMQAMPTFSYDSQAVFMTNMTSYDLIANIYSIHMWPRTGAGLRYPAKAPSEDFFSPDALAGGGLR